MEVSHEEKIRKYKRNKICDIIPRPTRRKKCEMLEGIQKKYDKDGQD